MSDSTPTPDPIEGRAVCGETAASCRCVKDPDHVDAGDPVHGCNPEACLGQWTGSYDNSRWNGGSDWACVTRPAFPPPPASAGEVRVILVDPASIAAPTVDELATGVDVTRFLRGPR